MFASAAMALSSVSVVTNSLRLRSFQPPLAKNPEPERAKLKQQMPVKVPATPELISIDLGPLSARRS
jgi:hypothetical protein